jgi:predicted transcriptional regulator
MDMGRNIDELRQALVLGQPCVTKNVQILEEAGLVESGYLAEPQETLKRCQRRHDRLTVELGVGIGAEAPGYPND